MVPDPNEFMVPDPNVKSSTDNWKCGSRIYTWSDGRACGSRSYSSNHFKAISSKG